MKDELVYFFWYGEAVIPSSFVVKKNAIRSETCRGTDRTGSDLERPESMAFNSIQKDSFFFVPTLREYGYRSAIMFRPSVSLIG